MTGIGSEALLLQACPITFALGYAPVCQDSFSNLICFVGILTGPLAYGSTGVIDFQDYVLLIE